MQTISEKPIVMQCCVCGREKTEDGWQYRFRAATDDVICSHGFCAPCYETEMRRMQLRTATADALFQ